MQLAERQPEYIDRDDPLQREQMIEQYLPYVKRIVYRIAAHLPPSLEIEELINAGVIGLIQAIDNYDPCRQNRFSTYAVFRIKGAVLNELRSRDYLSRTYRKKLRELERAHLRLERKLGREAKDGEVAEEMGVALDQYYQIKKMAAISFVSLEEMGCVSRDDRDTMMSRLLHHGSQDPLRLTGLKEIRSVLAESIEELPEKEKLVIALYYQEELTMKEAGKVLDITESRVSQIHSQAILHLRSKLRKKGVLDDG